MMEEIRAIPQAWEMPTLSTEELHDIAQNVRHWTFWWETREEAAWKELVRRGEQPTTDAR